MREAGAEMSFTMSSVPPEGGDEDEELGPKISRNRGKIPRLGMSLALSINAQLTHPLYAER
jgi:hypothetical protein